MLEAEPAPLAARAQHGDVAAVGVDVHQLRIEREDPQRRHSHHRAAEVVEGVGDRPPADRLEARGARLGLEPVRAHVVERDPLAVARLDLPARRHRLAAALDHEPVVVDGHGHRLAREHPAVALEHVGERAGQGCRP